MDEEGENLDEEKLEVKSQDNHQDWKINLRSIRMNKNETIEKFHHLKWKEIMHLVIIHLSNEKKLFKLIILVCPIVSNLTSTNFLSYTNGG
jgi:hypothetical protein